MKSLEDLYAEYGDALDDDRLEEWLELFTEGCWYSVISRENFVRGLPLATMRCESRGMLADRVRAIRELSMYVPRTFRHLVSRLKVKEDGDVLRVETNFLIVQTLPGEPTELFAAGRYYDVVVTEESGLRFQAKVAVYDSSLVPNSLIYPL